MLARSFQRALARVRRILLAGRGGGCDVFGAVPLAVDPWDAGCEVQLARLSFCCLDGPDGAAEEPQVPGLFAVSGEAATPLSYCPEAWLARWLAGHTVGVD